ncbi:four-carbon acid sugar kinase family protein [Xenophilus arseniciresistens]|uniref:3-oxo-tetronate kinase n=1 Tax=Xenophilus arseniciresistens TaxID=1283306 RepID=A0AAE3SZY9_9BURK|nr:3-oxo-tetronate kinase [Xenophilus arseniciresistens]MDA7417677.1 four-carbon acid sugar kinase family protein [Xenophilus arseniciresistens]
MSATKKILLGCIADDFTGATDLANNLVRAGMRVVQTIGVPAEPLDADADAVVVALKSRTIPAAEAVAQSLDALRWLQAQGAQQIYFKYCSTFDSTAQGNIGPVTDALMAALNTSFTIATPAFPDNKRTVFKGYLFAGDVLLNESGMQNHPLTPMTDANLVRVLQAQTKQRVGLIDHAVVAQGADAVRARIAALQAEGVAIAIVDAVSNDDLLRMGPALAELPLLTAGSGVAIALPANFGLAPSSQAASLPAAGGLQAIVSGSCSTATNSQVLAFIQAGRPALAIDPLRIAAGVDVAAEALAWAQPLLKDGPVLIYSTAEPRDVRAIQGQLGVEEAGAMVERTLAQIARGLVAAGVRQLVVAGGETSGACVQALGIAQMRIGGQIDPGVPWCHALPDAALGAAEGLHITLKSGNFGTPDFFTKAFAALAA